MKNVFHHLLEIKEQSELRVTLAILAGTAENPVDGAAVNYTEIRSLTGLSSSSIGKAIDQILGRGFIIRYAGKGDGPLRYRVLWEKFRLGWDFENQAPEVPRRPVGINKSEQLKSYFTDTGFIDLLPQAIGIATKLGYATEEEIIQAVCLVFDAQRNDPPIRNRTAWFRIVFAEKLGESHAQILAFRKRNPYVAQTSNRSTI